MHEVTTAELTRDCEAVQIPQGSTVTLPRGTSVDITQTLGGSFTVHAMGGLYRVANKDADALGLEAAALTQPRRPAGAASAALDEQQIRDVLRTCYDPEIPVNILDLGLVYDLQLSDLPDGRRRVDVK